METLYHYCPTESFHAIVKSRSLWLSSLSLSNDTMEGKLVAEAMRRLAKKDSLPSHQIGELQFELEFFEKVVDGLGFCLSKERDLLSQWRGYAANATGVAIGFSGDYIRSRCEILTDAKNNALFSLETVEYDAEKHEFLVNETYEKIRPYIKAGAFTLPLATLLSTHSAEDQKPPSAIKVARQGLNRELLSLAPLLFRLKTPAFKEERELRLFSYLLKDGTDACDHRAVQDRIIPYRPLELVRELTPIVAVVLGPKHTTPPWAVKNFLRQNGFLDVEVERSAASYR